jgi:sugar diacid utilization regulator
VTTDCVQIAVVEDYSILPQVNVKYVETSAMIEPDELMAELEAEKRNLEALIYRSIKQAKDIKKMRRELAKLEDDLEEDEPIPSEQSA